MATTIQFVVYGTPASRGSKRALPIGGKAGGRTILVDSDKRSKDWMQEVKSASCKTWEDVLPDGLRPALLTGSIVLTCRFYFSRKKCHYRTGKNAHILRDSAPTFHIQKPDLSKITRAVEDALTGVVWRDDSQITGYGSGYGKYWTDQQS